MGMFDWVWVPCPKCGERIGVQSKGGECAMATYELLDAPQDVLSDVNRHAPFKCPWCDECFRVVLRPHVELSR